MVIWLTLLMTRAKPQSMTSTSPYEPIMMLLGLRSRWITSRLCANSIALQTCTKMRTRRPKGIPVLPARRSSRWAASVRPSISCMVK